MKKFLLGFILICFTGIAKAADIDFYQAVNSSGMPTDAEIMKMLSKFGFSEEQKREIFAETKKQLQSVYSSDNPGEVNARLNKTLQEMQNGSYSEFIDESVMNEIMKDVSDLPKKRRY